MSTEQIQDEIQAIERELMRTDLSQYARLALRAMEHDLRAMWHSAQAATWARGALRVLDATEATRHA